MTINRTDLENVTKEYNDLARKPGYFRVMYDTSDGELWIDWSLTENEWKTYCDDSIIAVQGIGYSRSDAKALKPENIEAAIKHTLSTFRM